MNARRFMTIARCRRRNLTYPNSNRLAGMTQPAALGKISRGPISGCSLVSTEAYVIEDHKIETRTEKLNATIIGLAIRLAFLGAAHVCLLTALIVAATHAAATPLNPFRYEAQARRHCPVDTVVWLDFRKGIYYFKQQKRYAQGSTGSFVCREEARSNGYRRSLLGLR